MSFLKTIGGSISDTFESFEESFLKNRTTLTAFAASTALSAIAAIAVMNCDLLSGKVDFDSDDGVDPNEWYEYSESASFRRN